MARTVTRAAQTRRHKCVLRTSLLVRTVTPCRWLLPWSVRFLCFPCAARSTSSLSSRVVSASVRVPYRERGARRRPTGFSGETSTCHAVGVMKEQAHPFSQPSGASPTGTSPAWTSPGSCAAMTKEQESRKELCTLFSQRTPARFDALSFATRCLWAKHVNFLRRNAAASVL